MTEMRFPQPDIVYRLIGACETCGKELWDRDGRKGTLSPGFGDHPLFTVHMWSVNCFSN